MFSARLLHLPSRLATVCELGLRVPEEVGLDDFLGTCMFSARLLRLTLQVA